MLSGRRTDWWRDPTLSINEGRHILGLLPIVDPKKGERWTCFVVEQKTGNWVGSRSCLFLGFESRSDGTPRPVWSNNELSPGSGYTVVPLEKEGERKVATDNFYIYNGINTAAGNYNLLGTSTYWNYPYGTYPIQQTAPVYPAPSTIVEPVPVEKEAKEHKTDDIAWLRRRVREVSFVLPK